MPVREAPAAIHVASPEGTYPILIGGGLLDRLGELAATWGLGRRVVLVTDLNVAPLYGERVLDLLEEGGFQASIAAMPAGEANKKMDSVTMLVDSFLDAGLDRSGWVLALGGGVVGDTAGFAASIYMRGVCLVQVPTTLLAMADSSVGGKVGVDHPRGKNLLGAFKQPQAVVADLHTLSTLSSEQIACGMAEIIKAAVIGDPELFAYLEEVDPETLDLDWILRRAIEVKRRIVEADPHERGERALLNLGHTFGHAFESCGGYSRLHGFAVAQGMAVAFRLAERLAMCEPSTVGRIESLLSRWGLPVRWGEPDLVEADAPARVWGAMGSDKKRLDARLRLILPESIGAVKIVGDVTEEQVIEALRETQ